MNKAFLFIIGLLLIGNIFLATKYFSLKKETTQKIAELEKKIALFESPFSEQSQADGQLQERDDVVTGDATSAEFSKMTHDFGTIAPNKIYNTVFTVKNTGTKDLFISDAVGSCGCTIPEWSKAPIKPGETSEIKVAFDATQKAGEQKKTVTIVSNTSSSRTVLTILAYVNVE